MFRITLLLVVTMCAFSANSVLNRIGVAHYGMDPMDFAAIRVAAGTVVLWALVAMRRAPRPQMLLWRRCAGALALAGYMVGFSWAYLTLDAGLGALILFGVLQVVIFGWTVANRQPIPPQRWLGAIVAFAGLCVLLWPAGGQTTPVVGALAMIVAAFSWAVYTLLGRQENDALGATAANFVLCLPIVLLVLPWSDLGKLSVAGIGTAIFAGAVTSGLGYAIWYRILPDLPATLASIAQLSVPVLTVLAGVLILSEPADARLLGAGLLVLGGIAVSLITTRRAG